MNKSVIQDTCNYPDHADDHILVETYLVKISSLFLWRGCGSFRN